MHDLFLTELTIDVTDLNVHFIHQCRHLQLKVSIVGPCRCYLGAIEQNVRDQEEKCFNLLEIVRSHLFLITSSD